jgi:glycosyltransferase involved in cell wall biosynthesis
VPAGILVEQLYGPVPGGIGAYVDAMCRQLGDRLIGVSAFHRRRLRLGLPQRQIPLPSRPLLAAWQFLRFPPAGRLEALLAPSLAVPAVGRRTRLVLFVAGLEFLHVPESSTRWGLAFHRRGLANARRRADIVLTCSQASAQDLEAAGLAADRIRVIPLGVEVPAMSTAEAAGRRARLGVGDDPYFLSVGTREPRKNLATVVAAAGLLGDRPERWVVAGPQGWGRNGTLSMFDARFVGRVERADLSALYRGATALCYPSLYEGFGLPVAEALAHGTPVVTSNVSSLPEVAGNAGVCVDPRDPEAIAGALRTLAEETAQERAERVERGKAHAARYTWSASAAATWDALCG